MKLSFKSKLKMFSLIFLVCFVGIVLSVFLIDRQIDKYIAEIKTNVDINIEVVNNTNSKVTVNQNKNEIKIQLDESETTETTSIKSTYVKVVTESGLNIRQEPDIESEKVGTVNYGHTIKITEDCGDWYKTDFGFIYKEYTIKI